MHRIILYFYILCQVLYKLLLHTCNKKVKEDYEKKE